MGSKQAHPDGFFGRRGFQLREDDRNSFIEILGIRNVTDADIWDPPEYVQHREQLPRQRLSEQIGSLSSPLPLLLVEYPNVEVGRSAHARERGNEGAYVSHEYLRRDIVNPITHRDEDATGNHNYQDAIARYERFHSPRFLQTASLSRVSIPLTGPAMPRRQCSQHRGVHG